MKLKTLVISIFFLALIALAFHFAVVPDTFWHIRTGEIMLENRSILKTDPFTFHSEGEEWLYPSLNWLSEIQMALIFQQFGFPGLNTWVVIIAVVSLIFIYNSMSGNDYLRGFILILTTITARIYWGARPHIYSFLFTAIFIWVLENYRNKKSNRLWLLPIIMILWVNSHAGFVIGLVIILIYLFGQIIENVFANFANKEKPFWRNLNRLPKLIFTPETNKLILILIIVFICISFSPLGINTYLFPVQTLSIEVLQDFILEWQSPDFHEFGLQPFLWMILLIIFSLAIPSERKLKITEFMLIVGFGFMGFVAVRNIYLFALVATPILSHQLAPTVDIITARIKNFGSEDHSSNKFFSLIKFTLLIMAVIALALYISPFLKDSENQEFIMEQNPVEASNQLAAFSSYYRILNSYNHGGYLIWANPAQNVFIDGRTELYGDDFLYDWITMVMLKDDWKEIFDRWDFNIVMLEPTYPLTKVLQYEGWELMFEDDQAVILIKND